MVSPLFSGFDYSAEAEWTPKAGDLAVWVMPCNQVRCGVRVTEAHPIFEGYFYIRVIIGEFTGYTDLVKAETLLPAL